MKLHVLGSGTAIPLNYRASPSLAVQIDGHLILLDIGPGTLRQLARIGLNHEGIERIFLTHFHPDHTADLVHFLFATKNPSTVRSRAPFSINGARGLTGFIARLQAAYGQWLTPPPGIMTLEEFNVGETTERDYPEFRLIAGPTDHTPASLAYRLENRSGKSIVYSGDTGYCDTIIELARGADLLVLEASFPDGKEVVGHLTPSQAGRIAALAGVELLMLIHFYPECLESDITEQCRRHYRGELILGSDLLEIRF